MNPNQIIHNFLDPIFETQIKCSCTVDDFHGVENLISNNDGRSYFMAYSVVKPPVELEFHLCCTIELQSIKIWPKIDSLKSTGFEIYANGGGGGGSAQSEFRKVASHFNLQENGIHFINDSITTGDTNNGQDLFAVKPFYSSTRNQLRKVQAIKLIIKQTAKCVPVLKRIEIWGRVSRFATEEQKASVNKAIMKIAAPIETISADMHHNEIDRNGIKSRVENDETNTLQPSMTVPDEFLDAITYEIMALPMVLPSGKIIDSSTLVKHTEHEEKWGRVPSDPFTGQPYTETRKPVLDVHLKSQIDSFLLKNCNLPGIDNTARTVGSISKRRKLAFMYECENRVPKLMKIDSPSNSKQGASLPLTTSPSPSPSSSSLSAFVTSQHKTLSLDEAIRGVLKVGKYTTLSHSSRQNDTNNCFQCCESVNNMLYIITICSHLICRKCLIDKNLNTCKCGSAFNNIDVNKYH